MRITVAQSSGFCFGVNKAVSTALSLLAQEKQIYTYGRLVHNTAVLDFLNEKGAHSVNELAEVPVGGLMLVRAHGVGERIISEAREKGIRVADATCPCVARIHDIVKKEYEAGRHIVIIGDAHHPEVIGINGWCGNSATVIRDFEELTAFAQCSDEKNFLDGIAVVGQTTYNYDNWKKSCEYLKKSFKNISVFDTICKATQFRQQEAAKLSMSADFMVVIGDKKSSNTKKLYEICKERCENTVLIENASDLAEVALDINKIINVGITAGASTPDWVIKEVISYMDQINNEAGELKFAEVFEDSLVSLENGQIVSGKVIAVTNSEVIVNLGFKSDGTVSFHEYSDDPNFSPDQVKIGDEIKVKVLRVNDSEGSVVLSKKRVDQQKYSAEIDEAFENQTPVKVTVAEVVKGGVIAKYGPIRIFVPASQVTSRRIRDFSGYVGKEAELKIIELNKQKRKIIGSMKEISDAKRLEAEKAVWDGIEVGKVYQGTVKNLTNFGAFVDIGGVDGLVHLTELSWGRIKHPSEVLKEGDQIEVFVKDFDLEKKKISLGYRKEAENPWINAEEKYKVGDVVKAEVVRMVPFGAFVKIVPGIDALVHISQISSVRIPRPETVLSIGQIVEAQIIEADYAAKKINLSIKAVAPIDPPAEVLEAENAANAEPAEEMPTEKVIEIEE